MDSATKSLSSSSFFLLLLFTLCFTSFLAQAARNNPPAKQSYYYHVVNLTSLQPKSYCESKTAVSAFGSEKIRMASRNGPCAPHKRIHTSDEELLQTKKPNNNGGSGGYMEYFVTIGLGKRKTDFVLLVDTGSDTTWVGCEPCTKGCGSQHHLFDPSKSSTYVNGSCRSGGDDQFFMTYADKSNSKGYWGCDTLTIEKSNAVNKFQFGCAQQIQDHTDDHDGILGLGRGSLSLSAQGGFKFEKFSYCLPKSDSQIGYLVFGKEADKRSSSSKPQFTPLLPPPENLPEIYQGKSYYFVELIGMSVAGKQLEVDSSAFTSPGTIIDSGTSITHLPQEAYAALTAAFNESMASKYPAAASKEKPLHPCYNVEGFDATQVSVPDITFRFSGGVNVGLRPSGIILVPQSEPNLVCLGFAQKEKAGDLTIIGNHQQRQMGMVFDLKGNRVGFGTNNCAE